MDEQGVMKAHPGSASMDEQGVMKAHPGSASMDEQGVMKHTLEARQWTNRA